MSTLNLYRCTVKSATGGRHIMAWANSREHALDLVEAALTAAEAVQDSVVGPLMSVPADAMKPGVYVEATPDNWLMGKMRQQAPDRATRPDGMRALTQDGHGLAGGHRATTSRARGIQVLKQRWVRRSLLGAGVLVALGAIGVGALVPSGGNPRLAPSGQNPLTTLSGFTLKYVQNFNGNSIPAGWLAFPGVPGGESASTAQWVPGMCTFSDGEAHFMAQGIDSCGMAFYGTKQEYGAWFARLKGDSEPSDMLFSDIFLLWPANNQWPPEIDIYEDGGGNRSATRASVINTVGNTCGSDPTADCVKPYTQSNGQTGGVPNDGTQWHTYGVEWTPSGVTWLIDGRVIYFAPASEAKSPAKQPALPMNMGLQSQNLNGAGTPTRRETMTVDWAEEFSWNG
jgi:hypothetical protein